VAGIVVAVLAARNVKSRIDTGLNNSGNSAHPPKDDVTITSCRSGEPPDNLPEAAGKVTNHTSKRSHYIIHVDFLEGSNRVGEGIALESELAAGQSTDWSARGDSEVTGQVECRLDITRFASRG
jgi:hypothetical protein